MQPQPAHKLYHWLKWLWLLPCGFIFYWTARLGLNMPMLDDWELVPFISKFLQGEISAADWLAPYNESRLLFLRLLTALNALYASWNIGYLLIVHLSLALCVFLLFYRQAKRTAQALKLVFPPYLPLLISALFFSLQLFEFWTFSFTINGILNFLWVILGLTWLTREKLSWKWLLLAGIAGTASAYAYSNGILFFAVALLPLWSSMRLEKRCHCGKLAFWLLGSLTVVYIFMRGNASVFSRYSLADYFANLIYILKYFFALLGGGLANSARFPLWVPCSLGVVVSGLFVQLAWRTFFVTPKECHAKIFWTALGTYVILTAAAMTVGRSLIYSVANALSSRYTATSSLLWICVLVPLLMDLHKWLHAKQSRRFVRVPALIIFAAAALAGMALWARSSCDSFEIWRGRQAMFHDVRDELLTDIPDASLIARNHFISHSSWEALEERIEFLKTKNLSLYRDWRPFKAYKLLAEQGGSIDNFYPVATPLPWIPPNAFVIEGQLSDFPAGSRVREIVAVNHNQKIITRTEPYSVGKQERWRMVVPAMKLAAGDPGRLELYAVLADRKHVARIEQVIVPKVEVCVAAPPEFVFDSAHSEIVGFFDYARVSGGQVQGAGWARSPVTGGKGDWVLVTDAKLQVAGYARVGMVRQDVAQLTQEPRLLYSGWRFGVPGAALGKGEHLLKAWLYLEGESRALLLQNEFAVMSDGM